MEWFLFHMCVEMIKWGAFQMCDNFGFLAFGTAFDIVFDKLV